MSNDTPELLNRQSRSTVEPSTRSGAARSGAAPRRWNASAVETAGGLAPLAPPNDAGARLLELLGRFDKTQWWPADRMRGVQFQWIGFLLDHAWNTVPFYRQRLETIGFRPGRPLTEDQWTNLPRLTRSEIRAAGAALRTRRLPKTHGRIGTITTSGSTGAPVTVLGSERTRYYAHALTIRNHLWHRRDLTGTLAAIRNVKPGQAAYPAGRRRDGWGLSTDAVYRSGCARLLSVTTPVGDQAEWLGRQQPAYLITFPSNAEALANHCHRAGIEIPALREVMTLGEIVTPGAREAVRRAWNAPIIDVYSTEELNYLALQCPGGEHYHVQGENAFVEIVDESGRPCGPGETGKVVATALHNYATPLIRYEIGDYAEVGDACPCGRGLPVLNRVVGRVRNMLTLPNGKRFWPSLGDSGYTDVAPIEQFQFIQKTLEDIEIKLVARRPLTREEDQNLRTLIWSRLGHPFNLIFSYHTEIPRSAGGKYEDFKSELVS